MSIATDIIAALPRNEVDTVYVKKGVEVYGEKATQVIANLVNGKQVYGTFTTEAKPGFGGVGFESNKDIVGLMVAKIQSVLRGTAE